MKNRVYRFAGFELTLAEGELRTSNSSVHLQDKPLLLLSVLLDNPQRVVSREQLRQRMWGSDTFVDYEQGINVAIKKVRDALGDSAENPRFIETIARKGYRFLVPVEVSYPGQAGLVADGIPEATHRGSHRFHGRAYAAIAAVVVFVLGFGLYGTRLLHPATRSIQSIAVLPLRDLSPDSGQEYFAEGITEELITNLAQSLPLRVISRTSAMRYKQTNKPVAKIAKELGVDAVVEGAVARSGNRITVTVQLIDAAEDRHLWARTYDRNIGDLLTAEQELSREIAQHIGRTLNPQSEVKTAQYRPVNPRVYELCLMGRFHWNKRTAADLAKAVGYYQQAIALDANYAPAHAGLASVYALMPSYTAVEMRETYVKALTSARRALVLDDTLAEAHAIIGLITLNNDSDWTHVEPEFQRALQLNPNYAHAHHWFAFYLVFSGRASDALQQIELARQLDPLSSVINADAGNFLYTVRRFDEAKLRLRQAIELQPDFSQPHLTLALIELETGHPSDALNESRAGLALAPTNPRTIGEAGYIFATTGHTEEARKLLTTLTDMTHRHSAHPAYKALIHMGLGQRNEALDAIQEVVEMKNGAALRDLEQWHVFDELKNDVRFQRLQATAEQMRSLDR